MAGRKVRLFQLNGQPSIDQAIALIRVEVDFNRWGKTMPLGCEDLLKAEIER